jgi:phosphatidylglycerol---prolipoprotein diacylglyceryl transferase
MLPFINLGFIKIPLYGLCIVLGIFSGAFIVFRGCKKKGKDFYSFIIIAALVTFFSFIGAKLLFLVITYPLKDIPKIIFYMLFKPKQTQLGEGFVFYGGLIFGCFGYFLGSLISKCKINYFFEELTFLIPWCHAFGRLGCFCGGCCYGILYDGPFAVYYHNPITNVPPDTGIFPVQLLESLLMFIFALIMIFRYFKGKKVSVIFYVLYYSVTRFFLEYLRGDAERKIYGAFSTSQWISIFLFVLACGVLVFMIFRKRKNKN